MNLILIIMFILTWLIGDLYTTKIGYDIGKKTRQIEEHHPLLRWGMNTFGFHFMTIIKTTTVIAIIIIVDDNTLLFGIAIGSLVVIWNSLQIYRYAIGTKQ